MTQNNEREAFERLFPKPKVFSTFNEQQKLMGQWLDCKRGWETAIAYVKKQNEQQPKQIPDGWKLVRIEPTKEMVEATGALYDDIKQMVIANYKAMINASPTNTEVGE